MLPKSLRDRPARDRPQVRLLRAVMRANQALRDAHKEMQRRFGLSMTELDFIAALGNTQGLRMSDLAHAMITTPSNVTRVCAAMEKKGLAVRERSPDSDREVIARLTPEGEKEFERVFPEMVEGTTSLVDELLPADEQLAVVTALDRLVAKLEER